jgi:RNA polymerase sigma-70 factor (ECF subfamily)
MTDSRDVYDFVSDAKPDGNYSHDGDNEKAIIQEIINGNINVFSEICTKYTDMVFLICKRYVKNDTDAEDLTQEVFIKVFKSLKQYKGKSSLAWWIRCIAENCARSKYRWKKLQGMLFSPFLFLNDRDGDYDEGAQQEPVDVHTNIEETIMENDDQERFRSTLRQLRPKLREVLELTYIENKTYEEIAAYCNCPVGTVGSRLSKAHKAFADLLGASPFSIGDVTLEMAKIELLEDSKINRLVFKFGGWDRKQLDTIKEETLIIAFNTMLNIKDLYTSINVDQMNISADIQAALQKIKKNLAVQKKPKEMMVRRVNKELLLQSYPLTLKIYIARYSKEEVAAR